MREVIEFFAGIFDYSSWPPRWKCGYWSDFHGWIYIISELMVWTAYFLIPLIIINYFNRKGQSIKFRKVYLLFATFILLCGSTHFLDAMMFWIPMYRFNAVVRLATGIVSLLTVYHLVKILPEIFKQKTNVQLETEIKRRKEAEHKLQEINTGLHSFVYMASHDLQEPLRKISTYTSRLVDSNTAVLDDKSREYGIKIISSADRMRNLIDNILTLSALSENIQLLKVNPGEAVTMALNDLEIVIAERKAEIVVSSLPMVIGSLPYLSQLFLNLINNSLKFTERDPRIEISGERINDKVHLRISDNGIGIDDIYQKKIFNAFERVPSKKEYRGTGIGLAICKRIVQIHKGEISVSSVLGEGTIFRITLPAAN